MNVKDLIELLKQYPEELEVWSTWDESGEFFPKKEKSIREVEISYVDINASMYRYKPEWISDNHLNEEDYTNNDNTISVEKDVILEKKKVLLIT